MIQKVGLTLVKKNALNIKNITNITQKETKNIIPPQEPLKKQSISFIKKILTGLKNKLIALYNKIFKHNELKKTNKSGIALYDNADKVAIEKAKNLLNNSKLSGNMKDLLKREIAYAEKNYNIETESYSCDGLQALKNAISKAEDELKNVSFGKHLPDEDGIHIRDKFTDWQHGKNIDDMPQIIEETNTNIHGIEFKSGDINSIQGHQVNDVQHHTESSLLDAIEKNHNKRNQLEQYSDEVSGHSHSEEVGNIDEIPDSFFD